ncbi:MAG: hypothetical protein K2Y20_13990 [Sphingomonas sp.]|nr:hypothetical protein [Sphingomonas sp.]
MTGVGILPSDPARDPDSRTHGAASAIDDELVCGVVTIDDRSDPGAWADTIASTPSLAAQIGDAANPEN